jgi:FkbM family methyltransferase
MDIRKGLASYFSLFGIKGVATISAYHLFGLPKKMVVQPRNIKYPVRLRVRTSDVFVYRTILVDGEYDLPLASAPRTKVDAGANIGMTTIYYANKFFEARIIAVEPEPSNFRELLNNVAPYPQVTPVQAALWNRDCQLNLGGPKIESPGFDKFRFQVQEKGTISVPGNDHAHANEKGRSKFHRLTKNGYRGSGNRSLRKLRLDRHGASDRHRASRCHPTGMYRRT